MARFEPSSLWEDRNVREIEGMGINGTLIIPAPPPPPQTASTVTRGCSPPDYFQFATSEQLSPTESLDSAFASRPPSWNPSLVSHKQLLYGAPDFSVAIVDIATGNNERLSIPAPRVTEKEDANSDRFAQGEVLTMGIVGESQVWAGTAKGTLHVFELAVDPELRSELRFSKHSYTTLTDPVLHIATRQSHERPSSTAADRLVGRVGHDARMDVILGSPDGYVTVMSGDLDEQGGLKNGLKCMRKVLRIGELGQAVHYIAHVACAGIETYWCGCGAEIVILRRSDWKENFRITKDLHLEIPQRLPGPEKPHVTQLLSSEQGMWSCLSDCSTVFLWDVLDYTRKMHIKCRNFSPTRGLLDYTVQITALAFSYPLLLVGTSGGHLMAFGIADECRPLRRGSLPMSTFSSPTASLPPTSFSHITTGSRGYKYLASTHCGPYSVVSIHAAPTIGQTDLRQSPFWSPVSSPSSSAVVVVAVCGPKAGATRDTISMSQVQTYELVSTPPHSPASTPDGSISPSYFSPRKRSITSLGNGTPTGASHFLPPLSIVAVAPTSLSLLPLDKRTE